MGFLDRPKGWLRLWLRLCLHPSPTHVRVEEGVPAVRQGHPQPNQGCQGLQVCHWQVHPPEAPVHPAWCQDVLLQGPNHPVWSILKSQDSKMTEKTVEFTCMPAGRQADLYLQKV